MKGTFKITLDYLKERGAYDKELSAFKETYPDGGKYQEILDRCCAEGQTDWAMWLLHKVGATDDVRTYDEFVSDNKLDIVFAGRVEFKSGAVVRRLVAGTSIETGESIKADEGIKAGWNIEAGEGIKAGWDIEAGESIKAGERIEAGWSIMAGTSLEAGWSIDAGSSITAGTSIKAGWNIKASTSLEAGWDIEAGSSITAGTSINAGWNINAGWGINAGKGINAGTIIKAGEDYGIFAGLKVKVSLWKQSAKVQAKSKPENLISGYWEE